MEIPDFDWSWWFCALNIKFSNFDSGYSILIMVLDALKLSIYLSKLLWIIHNLVLNYNWKWLKQILIIFLRFLSTKIIKMESLEMYCFVCLFLFKYYYPSSKEQNHAVNHPRDNIARIRRFHTYLAYPLHPIS